jgi:tetrahydromethanopterin S-methyltransferase subunit H
MCQICRHISPKCAHAVHQTHRYSIHTIQDLVSELHDITGNPPHHQNLGKTSDASLTRIDSTRELSSAVFAINLDAHYDNSPITTIHTAP